MSGTIIKIKSSNVTAQPPSDALVNAELAYSFASDRLFIGQYVNGSTEAIEIGGQYYVDMLNHTAGTLTANSAIKVDVNKHVDEIITGGLTLTTTGGTGQKVTTITTDMIGVTPTDTQLPTALAAKKYTDNAIEQISIEDLNDVTFQVAPVDGNVLAYNALLDEWVNVGLSGDATMDETGAVTLADTGVTAGSYGSDTEIPVVTVDSKGRITSISTQAVATEISITDGTASDTVDLINDSLTFAGDAGNLTAAVTDNTVTYTLDDTGVTAGQYGSTATIPQITVDAKGRLTDVTPITVSIGNTLALSDDNGNSDTIDIVNESLTISEGEGINVVVADNQFTVSAELATAADAVANANLGVAAFDEVYFTVTNGFVTVNDEYVQDIVGDQFVTNGTHSGISATYDDAGDGAIDLSLTATGVTAGTYGSASQIPQFTVDEQGRITSATSNSVATEITFEGDAGIPATWNLLTDTVGINGADGVTVVTDVNGGIPSFIISGVAATTSSLGVVQPSSQHFDVAAGVVTLKDASILNAKLANYSVTVGTTTVDLGGTANSLAGLQSVEVDNLTIDGNEIASTDANGNISLNPNGTGVVSVNDKLISDVADPVNDTDAANKRYVDNAITGLQWKDSVNLLQDTNIALTGNTGDLIIDSHPALTSTHDGYRILLTGQTNVAANGIYLYEDDGATWTLTRSEDADTAEEMIGLSVFIIEGTVYGATSWLQANHYLTDLVGGNGQYQEWVQFSGPGTYIAGDGLDLTGMEFSVNVAATGGIEISADELQLKSSVAGTGLTYTNGVVNANGTTDRISVSADSIDIASTYVGQTSITTVGTISTGTWEGQPVDEAHGGTGFNTYAEGDLMIGGPGGTLQKVTLGNLYTMLQVVDDGSGGTEIAWTDTVDGGEF